MPLVLTAAAVTILKQLYQLGACPGAPAVLLPLGAEVVIELEHAGLVLVVPVHKDVMAYRLTQSGVMLARGVR